METLQILDRDIPALLGLSDKESPWSVWHRLRAAKPAENTESSLEAQILPTLVEYLISAGLAGAPAARKPSTQDPVARNPAFPVGVIPDIVYDHAEQYGNGFGIGFVYNLSNREWYRNWVSNQGPIAPPSSVTARVQAAMLACQCKWALIIPVINSIHPKSALHAMADPEIQTQIQTEILQWINRGTPPKPDEKASTEALFSIWNKSAKRREVKVIDPIKEPEIGKILQNYQDLNDTYREQTEQYIETKQMLNLVRNEIAEIISQHGPFEYNGTEVSMRVETPPHEPKIRTPWVDIGLEEASARRTNI